MSQNVQIIFIAFCGCCFAEQRDHGVFGVGFAVYLQGICRGEMVMRAGAVSAVLWEGCDQ